MADQENDDGRNRKRQKTEAAPTCSSPAFPMSKFFNSAHYSDIAIKFSDQQLSCHKVVVCEASDYFRTLCGHDAKLKEKHDTLIELKDDDPDAVYGLIKYLYSGSYVDDDHPRRLDWTYHNAVRVVANKYGVKALETLALSSLKGRARSFEDARDALELIQSVRATEVNTEVATFVNTLEDKHRTNLLLLDEYRDMMLRDPTMLWQQYTHLAALAGEVEMDLVFCTCGARTVFARSEKHWVECVRCKKRPKFLTFRVTKQEEANIKDRSTRNPSLKGVQQPPAANVAPAAATTTN